MAVASQRKCTQCQASFSEESVQHVCSQCGMPQPVLSSEDYFSVLGVPRRFEQDAADLERRFYQASRALHPDRFTTGSPEARDLSLKRMSFVNQAYAALKNRSSLRQYVLELEGVKAPSGAGTIPGELAESWFEIQDLLSEDRESEETRAKVNQFSRDLLRLKDETELKLLSLEKTYDQSPSLAVLESLAKALQTQAYLKSLEKNVERIRENAHSN